MPLTEIFPAENNSTIFAPPYSAVVTHVLHQGGYVMFYLSRSGFWLAFAVFACLGFSSSAAADDTIRCKSEGYEYNHCSVGISGPVRLERQLSDAPCRRGESWGYDRRGIWVDKGCTGEFRLSRR
jgi:hypothetical protein